MIQLELALTYWSYTTMRESLQARLPQAPDTLLEAALAGGLGYAATETLTRKAPGARQRVDGATFVKIMRHGGQATGERALLIAAATAILVGQGASAPVDEEDAEAFLRATSVLQGLETTATIDATSAGLDDLADVASEAMLLYNDGAIATKSPVATDLAAAAARHAGIRIASVAGARRLAIPFAQIDKIAALVSGLVGDSDDLPVVDLIYLLDETSSLLEQAPRLHQPGDSLAVSQRWRKPYYALAVTQRNLKQAETASRQPPN